MPDAVIRQMLRPFRSNNIRLALRTLVNNYPSHERFLHFWFFLKLPARHGNAVTSGTPKPDQQYRQAAGAIGQGLMRGLPYAAMGQLTRICQECRNGKTRTQQD
jgi:hypothetical protein